MPIHTDFKHGTFSWVDLGTTDADAAKRFYGGLFGWTFDDMPAGPNMTYTMCKLNGVDACGLYKMGAEMKGMPPNWAAYINVDNVDERTKKVTANGGKVLKDAFDVMDAGRMSVIQDPSGGIVSLWQSKGTRKSVAKDPGALCWNELFSTNVDAAGKFYIQTIGWTTESMDMGPMGTYTLFNREGETKEDGNAAGMLNMPPNMKGVPSHWLSYFAVTDCDASAKKVSELGGKVVMPPMDIPNIGRFAIVQDPQGATFALFKTTH